MISASATLPWHLSVYQWAIFPSWRKWVRHSHWHHSLSISLSVSPSLSPSYSAHSYHPPLCIILILSPSLSPSVSLSLPLSLYLTYTLSLPLYLFITVSTSYFSDSLLLPLPLFFIFFSFFPFFLNPDAWSHSWAEMDSFVWYWRKRKHGWSSSIFLASRKKEYWSASYISLGHSSTSKVIFYEYL